MDIHCNRCREPWDSYHLVHEAVWDAVDDLGEEACQNFGGKLTPRIKAALKDHGWEFGMTVCNVKRCPCCPDDAEIDADRAAMANAVEEIMGDDLDGIISTMDDLF